MVFPLVPLVLVGAGGLAVGGVAGLLAGGATKKEVMAVSTVTHAAYEQYSPTTSTMYAPTTSKVQTYNPSVIYSPTVQYASPYAAGAQIEQVSTTRAGATAAGYPILTATGAQPTQTYPTSAAAVGGTDYMQILIIGGLVLGGIYVIGKVM